MVKKSTLEKLSDNELIMFLQPESRKVSHAIKFAKEILIERGHKFSEIEDKRIDELIKNKLFTENDFPEETPVLGIERWLPKEETCDIDTKTDYDLYSNRIIAIFSLIFGVFFGSILLILNFLKIGKVGFAIITMLYCILFLILVNQYQQFVFDIFKEFKLKGPVSAHLIVGLVGYAGLNSIIQVGYSKKNNYGTKAFIVPAAISIVFLLIYIIIHTKNPELTRQLGLDFILGKRN